MKRHVPVGFTALLLLMLLGAVPANAQSAIALRANIPFDFSIGDKTLPAGEYTIKTLGTLNRTIMLRNALGDSALCQVRPTGTRSNGSEVHLVFKSYGTRYFLSSVLALGNSVALSTSPNERALLAKAEKPVSTVLTANAQR